MNQEKIAKMDEEVKKWSRKDPQAIKKAMVYPGNEDDIVQNYFQIQPQKYLNAYFQKYFYLTSKIFYLKIVSIQLKVFGVILSKLLLKGYLFCRYLGSSGARRHGEGL